MKPDGIVREMIEPNNIQQMHHTTCSLTTSFRIHPIMYSPVQWALKLE